MAEEKWKKTKPHVNVGTMSHVDHRRNKAISSAIMASLRPGLCIKLKPEDLNSSNKLGNHNI